MVPEGPIVSRTQAFTRSGVPEEPIVYFVVEQINFEFIDLLS